MDIEKFICPHCQKNNIVVKEDNFHCANEQCKKEEILSIYGKLILINFEESVASIDNFINYKYFIDYL